MKQTLATTSTCGNHLIRLYHGSTIAFNKFDPSFYNSGEGVSRFKGWYFTDNLKGAYYHCTRYLRSPDGYIYDCEIPMKFITLDCEGGYTDAIYGCQAYGVLLIHTDKIKIIEVLSVSEVEKQLYS